MGDASRARLFLHDASLRRVGQVATAARINRSYTLDEPGLCEFGVSLDDPLVREVSPILGRIVVVESDAYPYPWVGRVTAARATRGGGTVNVTASGFESIFDHRYIDGAVRMAGSPADAMRAVLGHVNATNPTGVGEGPMADGPVQAGTTLVYSNAREAFDGIAALVGYEWWVDVITVPADIRFVLAFRQWRGFDNTRAVALVDGGNCAWLDWAIDGEAFTYSLTVLGGAVGAGDALIARPSKRAVPAAHKYLGPHGYLRYGPGEEANLLTRHDRLVLAQTLRSQGQVEAAAEVALLQQRTGGPPLTVRVTLPLNAAVWSKLGLGDVIHLSLPGAFLTGFDGPARVRGVQPMEEDGDMELVLELLRSLTDEGV